MANDLELAEELGARLNGLRRVLRRRVRATLDGPALPGGQVELLRLVETEPGIGVSAAARTLTLAGNSVSTLVNQLTEAGYLRRETDPADRRGAQLFLTEAAAQRLDTWRANRAAIVGAALTELSPAERTAIATALPALARLTEALAQHDEEAT
ncbi:MarR family winged helix-turn-helix transcriptional regulator [Luedemannella helvata]|uniref:MarR family transcriptional regulator n=1 Tax=Luedemannella helvata TaxID=349315 RepID=A0ABN2KE01_9ACTN